jgi:hypothetical protein
VAVDQRVRELPLRAGDLKAVSLERSGRCAGRAKRLALGDEPGDADGKQLDRGAVPAPPKARRTKMPQ